MFTSALRMREGDTEMPSALQAERSRAIQPQAWGEDMLVPFMSIDFCMVQFETEVMAPPGAHTVTP